MLRQHLTRRRFENQPVSIGKESAILVGVVRAGQARWEVEDALDELELLADTAGAVVTDRIIQALPQVSAATYIGKGKVKELKHLVGRRNSDLVIFDDDLSPVQLRNLDRALGCKLLDRSGLILDIFATRAKTATAKTQVELAQLEYLRTRLTRQWTHLSRQKGGIGTKGPGETQIETDRRLIGRRISVLQDRLDRIDRQRTTQRKRRSDQIRIALVGYTNAGKSTLLNTLADTSVFAEDRLFATLDATTRRVSLSSSREVLVTDTVGFIRKLPHRLIESFKSTLDEVRESDVLIHVVDVSHPNFEEQIQVVNQTLAELESLGKPTLMVFNKVDTLQEKGVLAALRETYDHVAFVSALRGIGLSDLQDALLELIDANLVERVAYLPMDEYGAVAHIHRVAEVLAEDVVLARNGGGPENEPRPVVRLRFRTQQKHAPALDRMLASYAGLKPMPESIRI